MTHVGAEFVRVAVAVVRDAADRLLLGQRHPESHLGGYWEFPGGKLEAGESPLRALRRELREEIGIEATRAELLLTIRYRYPDKQVELIVFEVTAWRGEPLGAEGQALRWVAPAALKESEMPAANTGIVAACRIPSTVFASRSTPAYAGFAPTASGALLVAERPLRRERRGSGCTGNVLALLLPDGYRIRGLRFAGWRWLEQAITAGSRFIVLDPYGARRHRGPRSPGLIRRFAERTALPVLLPARALNGDLRRVRRLGCHGVVSAAPPHGRTRAIGPARGQGRRCGSRYSAQD